MLLFSLSSWESNGVSSLHGVHVCKVQWGGGEFSVSAKQRKAHKACLPGVAIGSTGNLH